MSSLSAVDRPNKVQQPRLLLDLSTSLAWQGKLAVGIVRTEREIAIRLLDSPTLCVIPVVYRDHSLRALEPDFARSLVAPVAAGANVSVSQHDTASGESAPGTGRNTADPGRNRTRLARVIRPVAALGRLAARRLVGVVPERSREEFRLSLIYARQALRQLVYPPVDLPVPQPAAANARSAQRCDPDLSLVVHPQPTDILFLCGLGWDVIDWRRLSALRAASGMRIVSLMHDLIPIKFPEFLGAPGDYYLNYFIHMIDNSDKIFCNSRCTQADLYEFIDHHRRPPVPTEVIYLGANVPATPDATEITDPAVREQLSRGRFALAVGTFEIRKNYSLLIDLWEELLPDPAFDLDLVIVGMPGWCVDDVIARLEALPVFGTRIFWFKRLSDAGLSWLYENCLISLYPSFYEGWGLPVVEALQHGRPVIASSRGATPEAGFGVATILDPEDRAAWRDAVLAAARAPRQVVEIAPGRLPDWDSTTAAVQRGVLDIMPAGVVAA